MDDNDLLNLVIGSEEYLKQTTVGYKNHVSAWYANPSTMWYKGLTNLDQVINELKSRVAVPVPVPVPVPLPTLRNHVDTWCYDDDGNNSAGSGASSSFVKEWATYVESLGDTSKKAVIDVPGGSFRYMDCARIYYDSPGSSIPLIGHDSESWWLHKPGTSATLANRLIASFNGVTHAYLLNLANPSVINWLVNYARSNYENFYGLFMDDMAADLKSVLYPSGFDTSLEVVTYAAWKTAQTNLYDALTKTDGTFWKLVPNCFFANEWVGQGLWMLDHPHVIGGLLESSPCSSNTMVAADRYANSLDIGAYAANHKSGFVIFMSNAIGDLTNPRWRLVHAATILLTYEEGVSVSWTDYNRDVNLPIYPEASIYPTDPKQSMSAPINGLAGGGLSTGGGHVSIQVAPNVYRREFGEVFKNGTSIGKLAVLVNAGTSQVVPQSSWFTNGSYTHQMTLSGTNIQAGGSINPTGANFSIGSTPLPAQSALLLTA